MDQSEVIRMISTFNSRWVLSERRHAKCQQELTEIRQSLAQTNRDLDEVAKLAEVLYETNRRMGLVTDYLLNHQGLKDGDKEPKSFDAMFNWVVVQAGLSSGAESEDGGTAISQLEQMLFWK
ncbi:hypothetical protein N7490_006287 [Penicillium lividum]|nr:hypothetical protein N7490_006287 [Penicillium lividum]